MLHVVLKGGQNTFAVQEFHFLVSFSRLQSFQFIIKFLIDIINLCEPLFGYIGTRNNIHKYSSKAEEKTIHIYLSIFIYLSIYIYIYIYISIHWFNHSWIHFLKGDITCTNFGFKGRYKRFTSLDFVSQKNRFSCLCQRWLQCLFRKKRKEEKKKKTV